MKRRAQSMNQTKKDAAARSAKASLSSMSMSKQRTNVRQLVPIRRLQTNEDLDTSSLLAIAEKKPIQISSLLQKSLKSTISTTSYTNTRTMAEQAKQKEKMDGSLQNWYTNMDKRVKDTSSGLNLNALEDQHKEEEEKNDLTIEIDQAEPKRNRTPTE